MSDISLAQHGFAAPDRIEVRGARVHNLKGVDVDVPLGRLVGVTGVSGSGKSSLALGVLYAKGSRRYLEALSTYTRRRLTQAGRASVDRVLHVPAALALHQRPSVPGVRSTFGTMTELLNSLRLLFSRVGAHPCPNCGAYHAPSLGVAAEQALECASCGASFFGPGAEELAFNSAGACPTCSGTGVVREVDRDSLVPDDSKTINEGAVAPWGSLMWDLMKQVAGAMGVRTDVPFRELTDEERRIVFEGPAVKKHILYKPKKGDDFAELDFTYFNAVYTVENALAKAKDEKGLKRVSKFLKEGPCAACGGTRLSDKARAPRVGAIWTDEGYLAEETGQRHVPGHVVANGMTPHEMTSDDAASNGTTPDDKTSSNAIPDNTTPDLRAYGITLAEATAMTLDDAVAWVRDVPATLPAPMRPMATNIAESFLDVARRLLELGLGYLSLDRAGATLSTGERQRVQLARAVRNRTTGVLYVLDEPSIGLHPSNVDGLLGVMRDLKADGNSVVVVDHDTRVLAACDHLIEMGPQAGTGGGRVIAQGTVREVAADPDSRIAPFLPRVGRDVSEGAPLVPSPAPAMRVRRRAEETAMFESGRIHMETSVLHTVRPLSVDIPRGRLVAVTGVSGSGKTTMVLESLIPALKANVAGEPLPSHVRSVEAEGIARANLIDATPIGANVRSTVATYADIHDDLRRAFARSDAAKEAGLKAGDFSYNTGRLRCPTCDGTGSISLDVQFLPDVDIECPDCRGSRYASEIGRIRCSFAARTGTSRTTALRAADNDSLGDTTPGTTADDIDMPHSLPEFMAMSVDEALPRLTGLKKVRTRLITLHDLGLGYLTLGEPTPALSGGEAQRLKLASEMGRAQADAVFVFDEPTIGLHPEDVKVLLGVFDHLVAEGATVVVIEHDLDVIANADWIIDMGPGGGASGGRIVATGTPERIAADSGSITGRYLRLL